MTVGLQLPDCTLERAQILSFQASGFQLIPPPSFPSLWEEPAVNSTEGGGGEAGQWGGAGGGAGTKPPDQHTDAP